MPKHGSAPSTAAARRRRGRPAGKVKLERGDRRPGGADGAVDLRARHQEALALRLPGRAALEALELPLGAADLVGQPPVLRHGVADLDAVVPGRGRGPAQLLFDAADLCAEVLPGAGGGDLLPAQRVELARILDDGADRARRGPQLAEALPGAVQSTVANAPPKDDPTAAPTTTPRPTEESNAMCCCYTCCSSIGVNADHIRDESNAMCCCCYTCCCYTGSPEPEPKTLFDRILDWSVPATAIAPAVAAVALAVATAPPGADPVVTILVAATIFVVLLPPVGLAACFVTGVVAVLCAAIQATWSTLRR